MLVKFKTSLVGKVVIKPGEVVDMPGDEALRHIQGGNAERAGAVETAVFRAKETAESEQRALMEKETAAAKETRKR